MAAVVAILNVVGSVASVLSLIVALRVTQRLLALERSYLRRAVSPDYVIALQAHLANFDRASARKQAEQAQRNLLKCQSMLISMKPLMGESHLERLNQVIEIIERISLQNDALFLTRCASVSARLHGVLELARNIAAEVPWRQNDV